MYYGVVSRWTGPVRHVVYYGLTLLGLLWASSCGDGDVTPRPRTRFKLLRTAPPQHPERFLGKR